MNKRNMTKTEALTALRSGYRVSREYFDDEEYIYMDDTGAILSEENWNFEDWWETIEPSIPKTSETPWSIWNCGVNK